VYVSIGTMNDLTNVFVCMYVCVKYD
jgi:hypothetical protein